MTSEKPKFPTAALLRTACLALALASASASATSALEGRAFIGPTGPRGEAAERDDEKVEFAGGRFRSSICEEMGFPPNAYRATREGDAVRFESVLASDKDGTIRWQGTVRGDAIEATYVWEKKGVLWDTRREYWFRGKPAGR